MKMAWHLAGNGQGPKKPPCNIRQAHAPHSLVFLGTDLRSGGTGQPAHLLAPLADAALALEEALHLLLGPVGHVVPHPVAGRPDARAAPQEGKVVQVPPKVCRQRQLLSQDAAASSCLRLLTV